MYLAEFTATCALDNNDLDAECADLNNNDLDAECADLITELATSWRADR